jgi:protein tyrosine phosphatase
VVWQQDVRVIVMLTAEQEGGQVKAHNYWSDKHYGHLHWSLLRFTATANNHAHL